MIDLYKEEKKTASNLVHVIIFSHALQPGDLGLHFSHFDMGGRVVHSLKQL